MTSATTQTPDTEAGAPSASRPLRADAQRNRARLLEAAETVFACNGCHVGVDEIAAQAGVGVGTFYRHFPTKEALFEAIIVDRMERLLTEGRALLESPDPAGALFGFLTTLVDRAVAKRDLADALAGGADPAAMLDAKGQALMDQLAEVTSGLLVAAQAAGAVRTDVTTADLIGLVVAPCMAPDNPLTSACSPQRMLSIVCDGLRPASAGVTIST